MRAWGVLSPPRGLWAYHEARGWQNPCVRMPPARMGGFGRQELVSRKGRGRRSAFPWPSVLRCAATACTAACLLRFRRRLLGRRDMNRRGQPCAVLCCPVLGHAMMRRSDRSALHASRVILRLASCRVRRRCAAQRSVVLTASCFTLAVLHSGGRRGVAWRCAVRRDVVTCGVMWCNALKSLDHLPLSSCGWLRFSCISAFCAFEAATAMSTSPTRSRSCTRAQGVSRTQPESVPPCSKHSSDDGPIEAVLSRM